MEIQNNEFIYEKNTTLFQNFIMKQKENHIEMWSLSKDKLLRLQNIIFNFTID